MHATPPDNKDPNAPWYHMPANGLGEAPHVTGDVQTPETQTCRQLLCMKGAYCALMTATRHTCSEVVGRCLLPGLRGTACCESSSRDDCFLQDRFSELKRSISETSSHRGYSLVPGPVACTLSWGCGSCRGGCGARCGHAASAIPGAAVA